MRGWGWIGIPREAVDLGLVMNWVNLGRPMGLGAKWSITWFRFWMTQVCGASIPPSVCLPSIRSPDGFVCDVTNLHTPYPSRAFGCFFLLLRLIRCFWFCSKDKAYVAGEKGVTQPSGNVTWDLGDSANTITHYLWRFFCHQNTVVKLRSHALVWS